MIKQIQNILETYKNQKGALDREKTTTLARWKEDLSEKKIAEHRPELERNYLEKENTLKAATLAAIEKELSKAERWVAFMVQDIHPETLAEINALQGMGVTEYETNLLLEKYTGDYWASAKLIDMLNANRSDLNKISYTRPEELLQAVSEIKRDCAFILNNYMEDGEVTPGQNAAVVSMALIEKNFMGYVDRFTTSYISEPDFDRPAPLTTSEKKAIDVMYSGCESSLEKRERTAELADQGKGELISRSEYARYLSKSWECKAELSPAGKMLLTGSIEPEQYAGFMAVYPTYKPGDVMDLSGLTGIGAPNNTEATQGNPE